MKKLLLDIKAAVSQAGEAREKQLAALQEAEYESRYDQLVGAAGKLCPPPKREKSGIQTRRPKESPIVGAARKLVNRSVGGRDEILFFMTDFRVPFDNNQAERDLRMLKVKRQIGGCFRTEKGAAEFW
jgi:transposase